MEPWVVEWLSAERLHRYLVAAGHDPDRALRLYEWNANLNAALLHDFAHFEVGVRNLYDRGLVGALQPGELHWVDADPLFRLFPPSQGTRDVNARTRRDVQRARDRARGANPPPGAIMANLTFGFWSMLTANRLDSSVWPHLETVLPSGTERAKLHETMRHLADARNRVAHHEPTTPAAAEATLRSMRRIAKYVSSEFADHLQAKSSVREIIAARP